MRVVREQKPKKRQIKRMIMIRKRSFWLLWMCGALWAAGPCDDIQVFCTRGPFDRVLYAGCSQHDDVHVCCTKSRKKVHVFDALIEQELAGFSFVQNISALHRENPLLWRMGVREVATDIIPFLSDEMQLFLENIVAHSEKKQGKIPGKKRLTKKRFFKHVYPLGFTREWRVFRRAALEEMHQKNAVFVFLKERRVAFLGILHEDERSEVSIDSLLYIKRRKEACGVVSSPPKSMRSILPLQEMSCEDFLKFGYRCRGSGVGLFYFSDNAFYGAVFNLSGRRDCVRFQCDGSDSLREVDVFSHMRDQILRGFVLMAPTTCQVDIDTLIKPEVREAVCYRARFLSGFLCRTLQAEFLKTLQEQTVGRSDIDWNGLRVDQLAPLCSGDQTTLQWSIVDYSVLLKACTPGRLMFPKGTLCVLMQQEPVVLRGNLIFEYPTHTPIIPYSLASYKLVRDERVARQALISQTTTQKNIRRPKRHRGYEAL